MAFKRTGPKKGTIAYMEQQSKSARSFLLMALILTAANCVLLFTESDMFFLFSGWLPYWQLVLNVAGLGGDMAIVWLVVSLGALMVCWLMWNKSKVFAALAGLLMAGDTVYLITVMSDWSKLMGEDATSTMTLNLIFHILMVGLMIVGFVHAGKLEKARAAAQPTQNTAQSPEL